MALINGIYVHVLKEDLDRPISKSTHSVEEGIDITDTIKVKSKTLSLQGKIVDYTANSTELGGQSKLSIKAWISLVKKDYSKFDTMSFEKLNNELLAFENGTQWVDTGDIRYIDETGVPVPIAENSSNIKSVVFEVSMPYEGKVRIQNAYKDICAFDIINKSTTGYTVRDYWADAEELSDIVLSNTYNDKRGRIRTEFINYDTIQSSLSQSSVNRTAYWVIQQLNAFAESGALIKFEGRNLLENYQIVSFQTSHPNTIAGGAEFTMSLEECRMTANSYAASELNNDNVDSSMKDGGIQQVSTGDNSEVWYTTQPGDTVWGLVAADDADYKDLKREAIDGKNYSAIDWVMAKNPDAFYTPGDFRTMKDYVKILLGMR